MENISEFVDGDTLKEIAAVYADKGYDSTTIRNYLKNRNLIACIPFRKNSKSSENKSHKKYNSVRCVVERFFGWLKNGFHRTRVRYEKKCENYLAFVSIASFLMYCIIFDVLQGFEMSWYTRPRHTDFLVLKKSLNF